MNTHEDWKIIHSHPDYAISNKGTVMRLTTGKGNTHAGRIRKQVINQCGYLLVSLPGPKTVAVHRLVAKAFLGENHLDINHINGDKLDNAVENLEYVTRSENARHAIKLGLWTVKRGQTNGHSKLTNEQVIAIRSRYASESISQTDLAKEYSVDRTLIGLIVRRKVWTHL
jgi:hypothetical protein